MKKFRCGIGIIISIAMLLSFVPQFNLVVSAETVSVGDSAGFNNAVANASTDPDNPTVISVSKNFNVSGGLSIKGTDTAKKYIKIVGGNKTIFRSGGQAAYPEHSSLKGLIIVENAEVELENIKIDPGTKKKFNSNCIYVGKGATVTLGSGVYLINGEGNGSYNGTAVGIDGGTFVMNGGSISSCKSTTDSAYGGMNSSVVYIYNGGSFIMNGGSITGNTAGTGGIIYAKADENTQIALNAGTINNNSFVYPDLPCYALYYDDTLLHASSDVNISADMVIDGLIYTGSADLEWDDSASGGAVNKIENMRAGFSEDYLQAGVNTIYIKGIAPEGGISFNVITALYSGDTVEDVQISEKYTYAEGETIDITEELNLTGRTLSGLSARAYLWDDISTMQPIAYALAPQLVAFEFELDREAKTSAGVYDQQGRLIKTLWSGVTYGIGKHTETWDGTDDNGNIVVNGSYDIKVASNNVKYEKIIPVIGNTTEATDWGTVVGGYNVIFDMAYDEATGKLFYCSDHEEGDNALLYLNSNNLSKKGGALPTKNMTATHAATDGKRIYWAAAELNYNTGTEKYGGDIRSFVYAMDLVGNQYQFTDSAAWQPVSSKWNEALTKANFKYGINYVLKKGSNYAHTNSSTYPLSSGAEFVLEYDANNPYNRIGGIEVQKNGSYLFTAYRDLGKVFVNNKLTGERVYTLDIAEPSAMAKSSSNDVYVYIAYKAEGGYNVGKFAVSGSGSLSKQSDILTGLDTVIAMAVNPDNSKLAVVEGGNTRKLSVYAVDGITKVSEYGSGESYVSDTTIKDDKLMFRDNVFMYSDLYEHSFVEFDSNNTLLMGDSGNTRVLKLDVSRGEAELLDKILYQRYNYSTWCVANEPTMVLSDYKEYSIDYEALEEYIANRENEKDYSGFEKVWKVEKNYLEYTRESVPDFKETLEGWCYRATMFPNGYVYFGMSTSDGMFMYKMSPDKVITDTGIDIKGKDIHADGSLWWKENSGNKVTYYMSELIGFDANNNPIYGSAIEQACIDYTGDETSPKASYDLVSLTESNRLIMLNAPGSLKTGESQNNAGKSEDDYDTASGKVRMHLGAINLNGNTNEIQWMAAPGTLRRYDGFFPGNGYFEMGGDTLYTARNVMTYENNVIFHYRGEGHSQNQSSKIYHFTDDGLFVGIFGKSLKEYGGEFLRTPDSNIGEKSREGLQEDVIPVNSFCLTITGAEGNSDVAYIYQNTEFYATGVHITRITGLDSIKTQTIEDVPFENQMADGIAYTVYSGNDCNSAMQIDCGISDSVNIPAITESTGERSVRFDGYFKTDKAGTYRFGMKTDGKAELYIDGSVIMEGTGDMTNTVSLEDDRLIKFTLEVSPSEAGELSYLNVGYLEGGMFVNLDNSNVSSFRPRESENGKINLLDGIRYGTREDGIVGKYGWSFENLCSPDDTYATSKIEANNWNYKREESPDINMIFKVQNATEDNDEVRLERSLGNINSDSWKIEMDVRWQESFAAWQKNFVPAEGRDAYGRNGFAGNLIEVLDVNGRTIANFYIYGARAEEDKMAAGEDVTLFYVKVNDGNYFTTPKAYYIMNVFNWSNWATYAYIRKFENVPFNLPKTLIFEPDGDKVKVKYGDIEAMSFDLADPEADITKPATVRFAACNDYGTDNNSFVGKGMTFTTNVTRFELTK